MTFERISNMFAIWAAVLTAIVTAYALIYTYRESVSKQVDDRRRQTFELFQQFSSRDFMTIREKALTFMRAAEACKPLPVDQINITDSEAFAFVEFFDLVSACADAGLCDGDLVRQFFVPYANGHWLAFKPFVESVRRTEAKQFKVENAFGIGLEKLGGEQKSFPRC